MLKDLKRNFQEKKIDYVISKLGKPYADQIIQLRPNDYEFRGHLFSKVGSEKPVRQMYWKIDSDKIIIWYVKDSLNHWQFLDVLVIPEGTNY